MARTRSYEPHYQSGRDVCGDPFPEVVAFFDAYERPAADVLDLGCGQGRDALLAARRGHRVVGVDLSATGIAQMLDDARSEGLDVEGLVGDIAAWKPTGMFDVVLLDRVLHLLADDAERMEVLERASAHIRPLGHLLIAETPKQRALLEAFFASRQPNWTVTRPGKGLVFAQRGLPASG